MEEHLVLSARLHIVQNDVFLCVFCGEQTCARSHVTGLIACHQNITTACAALRDPPRPTGLDGFIVPRADEYLGEYVPPCAERLAWITGFTGSAGAGRRAGRRARPCSPMAATRCSWSRRPTRDLWERRHIIEDKPEDWLRAHAAPGKRIGYDPWLMSAEGLERFSGVELVPVRAQSRWTQSGPTAPPRLWPRPCRTRRTTPAKTPPPSARVWAPSCAKPGRMPPFLTDPASLAWLFNIRGADLEFCPFALGYALLRDGRHGDSVHGAREDDARTARASGPRGGVSLDHAALPGAIAALKGKTVRYDPASQPVWFEAALREAGAKIAAGAGPGCPAPRPQERDRAGGRARRASARRRGDGEVPRLAGQRRQG